MAAAVLSALLAVQAAALSVSFPFVLSQRTFQTSPALFGAPATNTIQRESLIVIGSPMNGCRSENSDDFEGKIVLFSRGECSFARKAYEAQRHGAVGLIVANHAVVGDEQEVFAMADDGTGHRIHIPVEMISHNDMLAIVRVASRGSRIVARMGNALFSGDLVI
jgi:hypothetical protein